jgi:hypothetical protein
MKDSDVVMLIGAGMGGLSSGARLAHMGMKVLTLKQNVQWAGAEHAARPAVGYGAISKLVCIICHARDRNSDFDYASYKQKVAHEEAFKKSSVNGIT